ncbi:glycosyltransferase [Moheibacter sediminis]|uniref:Glycosyltransferase involved in cell wall bisynthesis n=1 Tax=Moheibacter sediminis TaxID=1434700 RepID=A0A1W2ALP2_9FLAO|nr:glycosyltransferase [Moheibacter sediminis]SMC61432.1 Glycosyltransferase involved in cell wall bisynthesis [Moheibacter sediminis]
MKKKILIRIGSLRHGGAEKVLTILLQNLSSDKYEVDLLLNNRYGKYLPEIPDWVNIKHIINAGSISTNKPHEIPIKAFRVLYFKLLETFPAIIYNQILKGKKYDVEIAANHNLLEEMLKSPHKNSRKIIWIHNDLSSLKNFPPQRIQKFFGYDKIMVISDKIKQTFEDLAKNETQRKKIIRIYNPLDTSEFSRKSLLSAEKYKFDDSTYTFVGIGTVDSQKGFDRLIKVHKKLIDEGLHHKILIIGDGPDFDKTQKIAEDLGVSQTFTMIGFVDNPYPYIKNADAFILSSRYEGFPTVLYEAITLQKTIVSTDVSGAADMLDNGNLGLIIENSEEGIYKGMKEVLTQPELGKSYQNKIANFVQPFTLENSVRKIEEIIDVT